MILLICIVSIIINCFIYMIFGSLIVGDRKGQGFSFSLACVAGFFLYHSIFMIACVPLMLKFQPLSYMVSLWSVIVAVVVILTVIFCRKKWISQFKNLKEMIFTNPRFYLFIFVLCVIQIILISGAYNFTLDATYYVGNVATSVATDSMNIYDPYTGNWQDHFEMRYFFATYSMNDAVICKLSGIPPLVQTKTIMTSVVVILIQMIYYKIAKKLFPDQNRAAALMMFLMAVVNFTFITIYTSSNFLLTRTFEGKSIVGNVVLVLLLYMYMRLLDQNASIREWVILFIICFGSTAISSSANMLVPATLSVLLVPLTFIKKDWKIFCGYLICALPGICMALMYVAYVKGYFVFHTYPIF